MYKQNDIVNLNISDYSHDGYGIGRIGEVVFFIPYAIIEEEIEARIVKVEKNFCVGEILRIIKKSAKRTNPICQHFKDCGGCDLMHLSYQEQLHFKTISALNTFRKIAKMSIYPDEVIGMEEGLYYRNKVQVPFGVYKGHVKCGYYRKKTHDIIDLESCYIAPLYVTDIIKEVKRIVIKKRISIYDEKSKHGCLRHLLIRTNYKNEVMVVFITNGNDLPFAKELVASLTTSFPQINSIMQNINNKHNNVILGDKHKLLFGKDFLIDKILDLQFKVSHYSFFQINRLQTEKLYLKVLEYLQPKNKDIVVDCYCGVGTIALTIAKYVKHIYGIEVVASAIDDANINKKLNHIENATFIVGKVEEEIDKVLDKGITALVVDPPRKGLDVTLIDKLKEVRVPTIVYVSCNIATLARDLERLSTVYAVKNVTLVDMFPQTAAIEGVVKLNLKV